MRKVTTIGVFCIVISIALLSGCCASSGITDVKDTGSYTTGTVQPSVKSSSQPEIGSYDSPIPSGKTVTMTISGNDAEVEYSVQAIAKGDAAFNMLNEEYKKEYTYITLKPSDTEDYIIIYETLKVISVKNPPVSGYDFSSYRGHITTSKGDAKLMITGVDKYSDGLNCDSLFPGQTLTGYTTLGVPKGTINERLLYYRNVGLKNYYFEL